MEGGREGGRDALCNQQAQVLLVAERLGEECFKTVRVRPVVHEHLEERLARLCHLMQRERYYKVAALRCPTERQNAQEHGVDGAVTFLVSQIGTIV